MNNLRSRTNSKKMSRTNMERAMTRIKAELAVMIAASPSPDSPSALNAVNELDRQMKILWYPRKEK